MVFKEQDNKGIGVWRGEFTNLRVPKLFELRADPFERGDESIQYEKWQVGRAFIFVPAQALVAQWLESFKEFPIRQKHSFVNLDSVMAKRRRREDLVNNSIGECCPVNASAPCHGRARRLPRSAARREPSIEIKNDAMKPKLGQAKFLSATYRLFKLDGLETACEDYGQAVIYKGGVAEQPDAFELDGHHLIERGKGFAVCGNTWRTRVDARFAPYFDFIGDFSTHLWDFPRLRDLDTLRLDRSTATSGSTVVRRTSRLGTAPSYRATVCSAPNRMPFLLRQVAKSAGHTAIEPPMVSAHESGTSTLPWRECPTHRGGS